jgi:hypothetical protein
MTNDEEQNYAALIEKRDLLRDRANGINKELEEVSAEILAYEKANQEPFRNLLARSFPNIPLSQWLFTTSGEGATEKLREQIKFHIKCFNAQLDFLSRA